MNIKDTFLKLTSETYPYGTEDKLAKYLPKNIQIDHYDNYFIEIGNSRSIFAAHLDTVSYFSKSVNHVIKDNMIMTDGTSILGADDKSGVTILLYMIENNIPGLYYFFVGEEVGCIGSSYASKYDADKFSNYNKIISFDRRGKNSVITHQSWTRTASDIFANALCSEFNQFGLNMHRDDEGICTDSLEFVDIIPECTNISVGYFNEHTHNESQDIEFLEDMCNATLLVDWENLPIVRDPSEVDYGCGRHVHTSFATDTNRNTLGNYMNMDGHIGGIDEWDDEWDDNIGASVGDLDRYSINSDEIFGVDDNQNIFFDGFDRNSVELDYNFDEDSREFQFDAIKDKYIDDRLSDTDIDIIINTLLDLDDPYDLNFAKELEGLKVQKNHPI